MGPAEANQSQLNIFTASPGEQIFHANKYKHTEQWIEWKLTEMIIHM